MSSSELFYSPEIAPYGGQSPRCYTLEELRAAKRLGLLRGRPSKPETYSGPLFWATGAGYPDSLAAREKEALQRLKDIETLRPALAREWQKEF